VLSELARKLLCIPASSASSERVCSTAGLTVTVKRNRLSEDQAGSLVLLRGSWEAVPALSRAALAESTITSTATTATTGSGSSTTAASGSTRSSTTTAAATGADKAAAGNAAAPASAADKRATLIVAAASLTEGTHAAGWSNGGTGRGAGVPKVYSARVLEGVVEVELLMQVQARLEEVEVVVQAVAWSLLRRTGPQALLPCTVMKKLSARLRAS
jgi:hAT family C-terminal dimerisation region